MTANRSGGDRLFREMLVAVESTTSIAADIRIQISMFGRDFNGTGSYYELKPPEIYRKDSTRFRLELQIQPPANDHSISEQNLLTVVCSRNYLYKYTSIEGEKTLERAEITQITKALENANRADLPTEMGAMYGLGGIAGMLREMKNRYDFNDEPQQTQINAKNGAISVWKIRGVLKPPILDSLKNTNNKKSSIPVQIPTCIDIYIGREDRFPFRFDYFSSKDGTISDEMVRLASVLYHNQEINGGNIPESEFDYLSSDGTPLKDTTTETIKKILNQ